jgi:hypothetical protein
MMFWSRLFREIPQKSSKYPKNYFWVKIFFYSKAIGVPQFADKSHFREEKKIFLSFLAKKWLIDHV